MEILIPQYIGLIGKYSQTITDRVFGNFRNLLVELGLESERSCRYLTDEELVAAGRSVLLDTGRINFNIIDNYMPCTCVTIINRFGTLQNFYKLIGYDYSCNKNTSISAENVINIISSILSEVPILEKTFEDVVSVGGRKLFYDAFYENHNLLIEFQRISALRLY